MAIQADEILKNYGVKPSYQRIRILQYLLSHRSHPTVDTIHRELQKEISTLSKTTVYNTLKQFAEKQIVQVVSMGETELRYDIFHADMGHFRCRECGEIYDFKVQNFAPVASDLEGFIVEETQICLKGICKKCQTK